VLQTFRIAAVSYFQVIAISSLREPQQERNMGLRDAAILVAFALTTILAPTQTRIVGMTTWVGRGLEYKWVNTREADLQLFDDGNSREMGLLKVTQTANAEGECSSNNLKIQGHINDSPVESGSYTFVIHENGDCRNPGQPMFTVSRSCKTCNHAVGFMTLASQRILQLDSLELPSQCTADILNVNNRAFVMYDNDRNAKKACGVIKCTDCVST
jgi:hypothetical protein